MVFRFRRLPDNRGTAWDVVVDRGYEGMVAKDPRPTYRARATRAWVEPRLRAEVRYAEIIGGRLRAPSWRRLVFPRREAAT
jgi:ATP-dependent DNA ligase